jgi:hypothetical protein
LSYRPAQQRNNVQNLTSVLIARIEKMNTLAKH